MPNDTQLQTLEKLKPQSGKWGGARSGAGRAKGGKNPDTLHKEKVYAEVRQRIMRNANKLINAQMAKAVGSIQIFEVVETETNGKTLTEHILVTSPDVIKQVLDEGQGVNCSVNGAFYIVTEIAPENRAIDSMLDRTFGKATQTVEITVDTEPLIAHVVTLYKWYLEDKLADGVSLENIMNVWMPRFEEYANIHNLDVNVIYERAGVKLLEAGDG